MLTEIKITNKKDKKPQKILVTTLSELILIKKASMIMKNLVEYKSTLMNQLKNKLKNQLKNH